MGVIFHNRYERNPEMAKEVSTYLFFKRPLLVACEILLALLFVVNMVYLIIGWEYQKHVLIFVPVLFLLQAYRCYNHYSFTIKRDAEVSGIYPVLDTVVTEGFIECTSSFGSSQKTSFDKIAKVEETKNFYLLITKANVIYIFDKNGFIAGDKNFFKEFFKLRCADNKRKK